MDDLTQRLASILEAVIERYVATGNPVGSRLLHQNGAFGLAPSTLRSELARLERMGYLDHPHTSAGRIPTDKGYRFYVDNAARRRKIAVAAGQPVIGRGGDRFEGELEDALRLSAGLLARATGLLALVSAPVQDNTAIRHVEVLQLHPDVVMVMVITASGGIAKKLVVFEQPVDCGLVDWARSFLNDALCGLELGSRRMSIKLEDAGLSSSERGFISALASAFAGSPGSAGGLYMDGVSRFFSRLEEDGSPRISKLMELLDRQDQILGLLSGALRARNVYLRIGRELPGKAMQDCSLVAASYGVAHRNLGTVGVLGPTRMDYPAVMSCVKRTACSISRFVEEIYH